MTRQEYELVEEKTDRQHLTQDEEIPALEDKD